MQISSYEFGSLMICNPSSFVKKCRQLVDKIGYASNEYMPARNAIRKVVEDRDFKEGTTTLNRLLDSKVKYKKRQRDRNVELYNRAELLLSNKNSPLHLDKITRWNHKITDFLSEDVEVYFTPWFVDNERKILFRPILSDRESNLKLHSRIYSVEKYMVTNEIPEYELVFVFLSTDNSSKRYYRSKVSAASYEAITNTAEVIEAQKNRIESVRKQKINLLKSMYPEEDLFELE